MDSSQLKVFLCHGSEDKPIVREIYRQLRNDGVSVWLDEFEIIGGQEWDVEIRKAVRQSHVIIVCLSKLSTRKEGYVQKEIKVALDLADEKPEGTIFIIPLKLEDCDVPFRLSKRQYIHYFEEDGYSRLLRALRSRAADLQIEAIPGEGHRIGPLVEQESGKIVYTALVIQDLLQKAKDGKLLKSDVSLRLPEEIVSISSEAMQDALDRFDNPQRRADEKELVLRVTGIQEPITERHRIC